MKISQVCLTNCAAGFNAVLLPPADPTPGGKGFLETIPANTAGWRKIGVFLQQNVACTASCGILLTVGHLSGSSNLASCRSSFRPGFEMRVRSAFPPPVICLYLSLSPFPLKRIVVLRCSLPGADIISLYKFRAGSACSSSYLAMPCEQHRGQMFRLSLLRTWGKIDD